MNKESHKDATIGWIVFFEILCYTVSINYERIMKGCNVMKTARSLYFYAYELLESLLVEEQGLICDAKINSDSCWIRRALPP